MQSDIRGLLNKMKWHSNCHFGKVKVWFISRGAPGDIDCVLGADIIALKPRVFQTAEKTIPYHRVLRIDYGGQTIFEV